MSPKPSEATAFKVESFGAVPGPVPAPQPTRTASSAPPIAVRIMTNPSTLPGCGARRSGEWSDRPAMRAERPVSRRAYGQYLEDQGPCRQGPGPRALAAFHAGGIVSDDEDSPHLSAGAISAELYFGHADNDQSMTPQNVAALEQALDEAGVRYRSELYEGAAHGYTMSDTAVYDEAAAERHFTELFALLDRTIGG